LAALLWFIGSAGAADDPADRIVGRLASYPVVRAECVQERTSASLTKPVSSSGRMVFAREHGVLWQVEAPVKVALVFTASGESAGGAAQAEMGRLIRAIIAGDLRELRTTFELEPRGDLERWTIRLTRRARADESPRDAAADRARSRRRAGGGPARRDHRRPRGVHALAPGQRPRAPRRRCFRRRPAILRRPAHGHRPARSGGSLGVRAAL